VNKFLSLSFFDVVLYEYKIQKVEVEDTKDSLLSIVVGDDGARFRPDLNQLFWKLRGDSLQKVELSAIVEDELKLLRVYKTEAFDLVLDV